MPTVTSAPHLTEPIESIYETGMSSFSLDSFNVFSTLPDVQGYTDQRDVALNQAGVRQVNMPLQVRQGNHDPQPVQAKVTLSVGLAAADKGTHMSRFIILLEQWSKTHVFSMNPAVLLKELKQYLGAPTAYLKIDFRYFMDKAAPVSGMSARMAYDCTLEGSLDAHDQLRVNAGLAIACATLCPCSKEISDYGAHNQRAEIRARINLADPITLSWDELITALEETSSCPVYPLIKRSDEKYITEKAYNNPKFVEDVIRDATLSLRQCQGVSGFRLEVEALESIHAHNAWAAHAENFVPVTGAEHGIWHP